MAKTTGAGLALPGWGARFAATRTGFPGLVVGVGPDSCATALWGDWFASHLPQGRAVLGSALNLDAVGGLEPMGAAYLAFTAAVAAAGSAQPLVRAQLGLQIVSDAVGYRSMGLAAAVLAQTLDAAPVAVAPPPGLSLTLAGDQPLMLPVQKVQGYHRPLNGAVASLTATVDPTALFPDWLAAPPLGQAGRVEHHGRPVMTGVLYAVRATATAVELRIEG